MALPVEFRAHRWGSHKKDKQEKATAKLLQPEVQMQRKGVWPVSHLSLLWQDEERPARRQTAFSAMERERVVTEQGQDGEGLCGGGSD